MLNYLPVAQAIDLPFEDGWRQWDLAVNLQQALGEDRDTDYFALDLDPELRLM